MCTGEVGGRWTPPPQKKKRMRSSPRACSKNSTHHFHFLSCSSKIRKEVFRCYSLFRVTTAEVQQFFWFDSWTFPLFFGVRFRLEGACAVHNIWPPSVHISLLSVGGASAPRSRFANRCREEQERTLRQARSGFKTAFFPGYLEAKLILGLFLLGLDWDGLLWRQLPILGWLDDTENWLIGEWSFKNITWKRIRYFLEFLNADNNQDVNCRQNSWVQYF